MSNADFFSLVAVYNSILWPLTTITWVLGIVAWNLAVKKTGYSGRLVPLILAFLWLSAGIAFGFIYFGSFVPDVFGFPFVGFGYVVGVVFVLQGIIFLYFGVFRNALSFKYERNVLSVTGQILAFYAVVLYVAVGTLTGYSYPTYPIFGSAPFPVAIFTIGMFLLADKRISPIALALPSIFGMIGILTVLALGVYADVGLFISGVIGFFIMLRHHRMK